MRQKGTRDTSEMWFRVRSVESSEVGEPSCRTGLPKSDYVEVEQVEYLCESAPVPDQPCSSATVPTPSLWKGKGQRNSMAVPVAEPNCCLSLTMSQLFQPRDGSVL